MPCCSDDATSQGTLPTCEICDSATVDACGPTGPLSNSGSRTTSTKARIQTTRVKHQHSLFKRERERGGAREPEDGLADWNVTHTHIYICYTPKTYLFGLARHIVKQCAGASEDQLL